MARESIKVTHAALDDDNGEIVLRGVIDPESLKLLKVGDYQREILPLSKIRDLAEAFKTGFVPDVDLGMRGQECIERDGAFYLQNDVYIVDGLQRRTAALEVLKAGISPRLGATIHFGTTDEWERNRFRILNQERNKLSPNVLLRNLRKDLVFVDMLYLLTHDKEFALSGRVCWEQRMHRDHLITALTLLKATARLHENFSAGLRDSQHSGLAYSMQKIMDKHGRTTIRNNIKTFWEVIDDCWGVKVITFKEGAAYLRGSFLLSMAMLFSSHIDFWKDSKLHVDRDLRRKIRMFPITDPQVSQLASASGPSRKILYQMLVDHVNSGKRINRLTPILKKPAPVEIDFDQPKGKMAAG